MCLCKGEKILTGHDVHTIFDGKDATTDSIFLFAACHPHLLPCRATPDQLVFHDVSSKYSRNICNKKEALSRNSLLNTPVESNGIISNTAYSNVRMSAVISVDIWIVPWLLAI